VAQLNKPVLPVQFMGPAMPALTQAHPDQVIAGDSEVVVDVQAAAIEHTVQECVIDILGFHSCSPSLSARAFWVGRSSDGAFGASSRRCTVRDYTDKRRSPVIIVSRLGPDA
jgi:hypothetical protein